MNAFFVNGWVHPQSRNSWHSARRPRPLCPATAQRLNGKWWWRRGYPHHDEAHAWFPFSIPMCSMCEKRCTSSRWRRKSLHGRHANSASCPFCKLPDLRGLGLSLLLVVVAVVAVVAGGMKPEFIAPSDPRNPHPLSLALAAAAQWQRRSSAGNAFGFLRRQKTKIAWLFLFLLRPWKLRNFWVLRILQRAVYLYTQFF